MVKNQEMDLAIRSGCRGPWPTVNQGDFAEEIAGAKKGQPLVLTLDHDIAADDHEELVAALPLAHQHLAVMGPDVDSEFGQSTELGRIQALEEGDVPESVNLLVLGHCCRLVPGESTA
jgi:hypothetical protein